MLKLIQEVDKKVNDLTKAELKALDWDSVPKTEFLEIEESRLLRCPYDLISTYYNSDHYSNKVSLHVFNSLVKNSNSFSAAYQLYDNMDNFFTDKFISENLQYILNALNAKDIRTHSSIFDNVYERLIERKHVSFFDVNISFDHICSTWAAYGALVQYNDWLKLVQETNFLHYVISECDIEDILIPLSTADLLKNGIGINPIIDLSWVLSNEYDIEDIETVQYLRTLDTNMHWDFFVEEFFNAKISTQVINTVWWTHLSKKSPVLRSSYQDYLKEGLPKNHVIGY